MPSSAFDDQLVLLDKVIQIFQLAQSNFSAVSDHAMESLCIRTAFIDLDFSRYLVQSDRSFAEAPRCGVIAFTCEQEVHGMTKPVNRSIQMLPLPTNANASLIHAPTVNDRALATTKYLSQCRQNLQCPAVHCGMINPPRD